MRVGLRGGVANYDLSGEGNGFVVGPHVDHDITRGWFARGSVTVLFLEDAFGYRRSQALPELSLGKRTRRGKAITPYLGAGIGLRAPLSGSAQSVVTLNAFMGLEGRVSPQWSVALEVLGRAVDPWQGTTAELTVGVARHF